MQAQELSPADIIWQQITRATKMSVGAREPKRDETGNVLTFKVTIKRGGVSNWIQVEYNRGTDEYKVTLIQMRKFNRTEPKSQDGVQVSELNEVIYRFCSY